MVPVNPHLEEFLANSRAMRDELNTPEIIAEIEEKLAETKGWNKGVFRELDSGQYGLKKRMKEWTIMEATVIADLYTPDLEISPFVVLYDTPKSTLVSIVKNFGNIDCATNAGYDFQPVRDAIKHMLSRGYGLSGGLTPDPELYDRLIDCHISDPNTFQSNLWMNIFLYDGNADWAMVDFNFTGCLANDLEIHDGANYGEGPLARLHDIWKILDTPEYKIGASQPTLNDLPVFPFLL